MITALDLNKLIASANELIVDNSKAIRALITFQPKNAQEYKANNKELKRLKRIVEKEKANVVLYKLVLTYISSGIQMDGIESQRNEIMIKIASVNDRLKYDERGILRDKGPLSRSSTNKEEKALIAKHDTKYGMKKLKQQLRVLNFILK
jgi:hypothetical protein